MIVAEQNQRIAKENLILFCLGGYLFAIAYGVSFLIPILVEGFGKDEAYAGAIISSAVLATLFFVTVSGHIADRLGIINTVIAAGTMLALASFGFGFTTSAAPHLMFVGTLLGIGWGIFYTLAPILLASLVDSTERTRVFAILSGSLLSGIGTGPLIGRILQAQNLSIQLAFVAAGLASMLGCAICYYLKIILQYNNSELSKISLKATKAIVRSPAFFSIIMVGLGGGIFGGLLSFQSTYAKHHGIDYALFFAGFMISAIICRLFLSGFVVRKNPYLTSFLFTSMVSGVLLAFVITADMNNLLYSSIAAILGVGYGLNYSVINGLAASEAPESFVAQSLLLFSLSYFLGIFGFPIIGGKLIVAFGIDAMLYALLFVSAINNTICLWRIYQQYR